MTVARNELLLQKLANFFAFLLEKEYVNRSGTAVQAIKSTSQRVLIVQNGLMPGWTYLTNYIKEWISPAYEYNEGLGAFQIKTGKHPTDDIPWAEWLLVNNVKYWEIEYNDIPKEDLVKFGRYLECFNELTSPFKDKTEKTKACPKTMELPQQASKNLVVTKKVKFEK